MYKILSASQHQMKAVIYFSAVKVVQNDRIYNTAAPNQIRFPEIC